MNREEFTALPVGTVVRWTRASDDYWADYEKTAEDRWRLLGESRPAMNYAGLEDLINDIQDIDFEAAGLDLLTIQPTHEQPTEQLEETA